MESQADTLVIGGGILGMSTALFLKVEDASRKVVLVEPDPTYSLAATPRASGGVRRGFDLPESIELSTFTRDLLKEWNLDGDGRQDNSPVSWRAQGYLFIATNESEKERLHRGIELQKRSGVDVRWLGRSELRSTYPLVDGEQIVGASLTPDDGWLDAYSFLQAFKSRAVEAGVILLRDRVDTIDRSKDVVAGVTLESGTYIAVSSVVNAAGVWASDLLEGTGVTLPVEPMKRYEHHIAVKADFSTYPLLKDLHGLAIRPESTGLSVGLVDYGQVAGLDWTIDYGYFEGHVWPALVEVSTALESIKLLSTSVGHYDQNRFDGHIVVGRLPTLSNYYVACGTSGHGLMHAAGIGRGLAELIVHGEFQTIDLGVFSLERFQASAQLSTVPMN